MHACEVPRLDEGADELGSSHGASTARRGDWGRRVRLGRIGDGGGQNVGGENASTRVVRANFEVKRLTEILLREIDRHSVARSGIDRVGEAAVRVGVPHDGIACIRIVRIRVPTDHSDAAVTDADVADRRPRGRLQEVLRHAGHAEVARSDERVDGQTPISRSDRVGCEDRISGRVRRAV